MGKGEKGRRRKEINEGKKERGGNSNTTKESGNCSNIQNYTGRYLF